MQKSKVLSKQVYCITEISHNPSIIHFWQWPTSRYMRENPADEKLHSNRNYSQTVWENDNLITVKVAYGFILVKVITDIIQFQGCVGVLLLVVVLWLLDFVLCLFWWGFFITESSHFEKRLNYTCTTQNSNSCLYHIHLLANTSHESVNYCLPILSSVQSFSALIP